MNNYSILRFTIGTPPLTNNYVITYNYGEVYSMKPLSTTSYIAAGFDTNPNVATVATFF
jgi:hypothetical protein